MEELARLEKKLVALQANLRQLQEQSHSLTGGQAEAQNDELIRNVTREIQQVEEEIFRASVTGKSDKDKPGPSGPSDQLGADTYMLSPKSSPERQKIRDRYQAKINESVNFLKGIDNVTQQYKDNKGRIFAPPKPVLPASAANKEHFRNIVLTPAPSTVAKRKSNETAPQDTKKPTQNEPQPEKKEIVQPVKGDKPKEEPYNYIILTPSSSQQHQEIKTRKPSLVSRPWKLQPQQPIAKKPPPPIHPSPKTSSEKPPLKPPLKVSYKEPLKPPPKPLEEPLKPLPKPLEEPSKPLPKPLEEPLKPPPKPLEEPLKPPPKPLEEPLKPPPKPLEEPLKPAPKPLEEPLKPAPKLLEEPLKPPRKISVEEPLKSPSKQNIRNKTNSEQGPKIIGVALTPKGSKWQPAKPENAYQIVVLTPKVSAIKPRKSKEIEDNYIKKELQKIGSKYPPNKVPAKKPPAPPAPRPPPIIKTVVLTPAVSVPTTAVVPRELPVILTPAPSLHARLPSRIPRDNKVHPEPEEYKELTKEERPEDLLQELDVTKRSELDMAEKILAMISDGNPKDKFLNQLKAFGIPDQKKLLRYLLDGDLHSFDFGGLMRKYYSYVLRSYTLVNMQDNYREPYTFSTCFAGLDVSKIGSKAEEQEKEMSKKLEQREEKQEDLRVMCADEDHFRYLKHLANEQPTTIPLTVLKGLVEQVMPILIDTYRTYARTLSSHHPSTRTACQQYLRMKYRLQLYNTMEKARDDIKSKEM